VTPRTISVIVNTYQRAESLARTLSALEQLDYPAFEVVVVNGPSVDHTEEVLDRYRDRIIVGRCLERNLSRSRNLGVRLASGEIVAFIDDDAYPDPAWLDRLAEAYDDPEVAAAGGPIYNYTGTDIQAWRSFVDRFGNSRVDHVRRAYPAAVTSAPFTTAIPYTIGTNSSFRRQVLVQIGGFDEEFEYYLEESDVCCRLIGLGYVVAQLDDGFVYHKFLPSWVRDRPDVVKDYRQVLKSKQYFALKHGLAAASFRDVCADITRFVDICAADVDAAVAAGLLDASDRAKFETDVAETSDAALRAIRAAEPRTREPEWFGRGVRPIVPFPTRGKLADKLHVCLCSAEYPPTRVNGIGRVVHALATGLAAAGHVVDVVTRGEVSRRVDLEDGVWVHRVPVTPHPPGAGVAVPQHIWDASASFYDEVLRIHEHRPVDILQAPNWDSEAIAAIEDGRIPVVVGLYTPLKTLTALDARVGAALDGRDPTIRDMVALERYCYERADGLLACGPSIVTEVESRYEMTIDRARLGLVAHGLADRAVGASTAGDTERTNVLFVGRLEPRKGVDVLLGCAEQLLERHGDLDITIAGDDSVPTLDGSTMRAQFERSSSPHGERVHFGGPVDDDTLLSLYLGCDILVVPSRYESFGLMLLEAMMFAKPVIASDVGGMREIVVHGETGLLVPPGDAAALAAAIDVLVGDPELRSRLGRAGRARYEQEFSHALMVQGVSRFYRSVLSSLSPRGAAVGAAAE
jgi:hypothetical protein